MNFQNLNKSYIQEQVIKQIITKLFCKFNIISSGHSNLVSSRHGVWIPTIIYQPPLLYIFFPVQCHEFEFRSKRHHSISLPCTPNQHASKMHSKTLAKEYSSLQYAKFHNLMVVSFRVNLMSILEKQQCYNTSINLTIHMSVSHAKEQSFTLKVKVWMQNLQNNMRMATSVHLPLVNRLQVKKFLTAKKTMLYYMPRWS